MHSRIGIFFLMALLALAPATFGAARKNNKAAVTFHLQAHAADNPKMIFPLPLHGKELFFHRMPEFSMKDIAGFRKFPCDKDELTYGIVLTLKPHAARRLNAITNANRGRWLAAQVNGRPVDAVLINDIVDDGLLVVWKNITLADIATLENALPKPKNPQED